MEVKLIGRVKVAKEHGLYVQAIKLNEHTYVTGQGIIPGKPETSNNLTLAEMEGKEKLSEEKMKRFPVIVNPHRVYHFRDGFIFDLDTAEGKAYYNLIMATRGDLVAKTRSHVDKQKHLFYIENKEVESQEKISKYSAAINAGIKLQELTEDELLELGDYFYVYHNESRCNRKQKMSVIKSTLFEISHETPSRIIEALKPENKERIHVSNFVTKGILTRKGSEFFEGNMYIAGTFDNLVETYRTDHVKSQRWESKMKSLTNDVHARFESPKLDEAKIRTDLLEAMLDNDLDKFDKLAVLIKKSGSLELKSFLKKYQDKLQAEEVVQDGLSNDGLLESLENDQWLVFVKKFKSMYPDSALTKKDEIREFLTK
jgi:hypothetical protein